MRMNMLLRTLKLLEHAERQMSVVYLNNGEYSQKQLMELK